MMDLSDYLAAGYLLIQANKPNWDAIRTELRANQLVSLSSCICPKLAVYWGWTPGDLDAALAFGIPDEKWPEFRQWCGTAFEGELFGFSGFRSVNLARRFIQRFLPDVTDLFLIGVGWQRDIQPSKWRQCDEEWALAKVLEERLPLELGGRVLGFEVVTFSYNDFGDSWLCSLLHRTMHEHFGIQTNSYGLMDTFSEAKQVYEWIDEDELKGTRAEPEPYYPWLLVSYPLVNAD